MRFEKQSQSIDQRPLRFSDSSVSNPALRWAHMCRIPVPVHYLKPSSRCGGVPPERPRWRHHAGFFLFLFFFYDYLTHRWSHRSLEGQKKVHTRKKKLGREKLDNRALETHTRPLASFRCSTAGFEMLTDQSRWSKRRIEKNIILPPPPPPG